MFPVYMNGKSILLGVILKRKNWTWEWRGSKMEGKE
jgi:hypothetical protein